MRSIISFTGLLAVLVGALVVLVADPSRRPFADEIDRFAQLDKAGLPPPGEVLFVGDSSIRLWTSLKDDMAPMAVINRGFGGAHIPHVNRYFDRIVAPYHPKAIVFYAGENDLAAGKKPPAVYAHFEHFMKIKTRELGDVPVFFISVNPSKLLFDELPIQRVFNAKVAALAAERDDLTYIDVVEPMLENGKPKNIFIDDGLHMNASGYAIWKDVVGKALREAGVQ